MILSDILIKKFIFIYFFNKEILNFLKKKIQIINLKKLIKFLMGGLIYIKIINIKKKFNKEKI